MSGDSHGDGKDRDVLKDAMSTHGVSDDPHFEPGRGWVRSCACGREFVSETWTHVPALYDHLATVRYPEVFDAA